MTTPAFPTKAHLLKAIGHKPRVCLADIAGSSVDVESEHFIDEISCLTPNYYDEELAESDLADLVNAFDVDEVTCSHIKEMHRRMGASTGRGSWPPGNKCHPDKYPHVGYHATTAYVDYDDYMQNSSLDREVKDDEWREVVLDARVWPSLENPVGSVDECKRVFSYQDETRATRVGKQVGDTFNVLDLGIWLAFEATRRIGIYLIEVFDGPNGAHGIHCRTYAMPGSLSGLGYFPDATCGDHVTCNLDSLNTYHLGRFTGLLSHELGHTIKFYHEFREPQSRHRSIMSYAQDNSPFQGYRKNGSPYQYIEDHSWPEARVLFGGEAAKPVDEIIIPGTDKIVLDPLIWETILGEPVIRNEFDFQGRQFIVVPKPSL